MRRASVLIAIVSVFVSSEALACKCAPPLPPDQAFFSAGVVFVGVPDSTSKDVDGKIHGFAVKRAWKGMTNTRTTVRTGHGRGDCGYGFTEGQEYLVYGFKDDSGHVATNACTRTRPAGAAVEDLSFLETKPELRLTSRSPPLPLTLGIGFVALAMGVWLRSRRRRHEAQS